MKKFVKEVVLLWCSISVGLVFVRFLPTSLGRWCYVVAVSAAVLVWVNLRWPLPLKESNARTRGRGDLD